MAGSGKGFQLRNPQKPHGACSFLAAILHKAVMQWRHIDLATIQRSAESLLPSRKPSVSLRILRATAGRYPPASVAMINQLARIAAPVRFGTGVSRRRRRFPTRRPWKRMGLPDSDSRGMGAGNIESQLSYPAL